MQRVRIHLENCYGIKHLETVLDYSDTQVQALYAPNGAMKSSLARTFQDVVERAESKDRIFPKRVTIRDITDEQGRELEAEKVLVVTPYDEDLGVNEQTSTLLLDPDLKQEYEGLLRAAATAKEDLLTAVRQQAHTRRDMAIEISHAIMQSASELDTALVRIEREIHEQKDSPYLDVQYDKIFNEKVLSALNTQDLKDAIQDYAQRYDQLLSNSTYFKKGTFDYYNAEQIATNLSKNGFFDANHTQVRLNAADGNHEIRNKAELEQLISAEKKQILTDDTLRSKFDGVARQLMRNAELRDFYEYVRENEAILSNLSTPATLRQEVIKCYIKVHQGLYDDWMTKHKGLYATKLGRRVRIGVTG